MLDCYIALVELLRNLIADEDLNLQFGNRNFQFSTLEC